MKKALVERTEPAPPERDGWCTAVQTTEDILIFNIYNNKRLKARHCINIKSGEYATWKAGTWKESQIGEAYDGIRTAYGIYPEMKRIRISSEGKKKIRESIGRPIPHYMRRLEGDGELEYNLIEEWEKDYNREKRERKEYNRIRRIEKQMEKVPEAPEEVKKWLVQVATGGTDYCIRDRDTGKMGCSGCGGQFSRKELRREDGGGKVRNHDRVLDWMLENKLNPSDMEGMASRLSPEQMMNYIMRQKKESYPQWSVKTVISQYEDYLSMCKKLHKDTMDEMVYRPRELKRRHDEMVEEIRERETEIQAEEYSRKFQEAEQVLRKVKKKLEYRGEKYFIRVPERIVEIVKEGRELHHCVGSTDRYFDRIKQQETYLCFLRKVESPETPYYTIEVEPGGTIRQHRGLYDEEPEIEEIRPFLREWQKEIRRRMTEKDRDLEQESARKREENLKKLREENNTRVLQGLMEDFMGIEIEEERKGEAN